MTKEEYQEVFRLLDEMEECVRKIRELRKKIEKSGLSKMIP